MIIDRIENAWQYFGVGERVAAALRYLQRTDVTQLLEGEHPIRGHQIFAMVHRYHTKPATEGQWEAHRKYADVQFVAEGTERIAYASIDRLTPKGDYDEEKDVIFLDGEGDSLLVPAGTFVIFQPQDAHMPGLHPAGAPERVRKAVVKILAK